MILVDVHQRSDLWYKIRSGIPTASSANKIFTGTGLRSGQAGGYLIELMFQRKGLNASSDKGQTDAMLRGIELEPMARDAFETDINQPIEETGFILREDYRIGCSPDGLVPDHNGESYAGLEIKCPLPHNHRKILVDGCLPTRYKPQVHASMAITGCKNWWFMSYCPGAESFVVNVQWSEYTDLMEFELDRFIAKLESQADKTGVSEDWRQWSFKPQN